MFEVLQTMRLPITKITVKARVVEEDDAEGRWVTINGVHILIKDGESVHDAFQRATGKDLTSSSDERGGWAAKDFSKQSQKDAEDVIKRNWQTFADKNYINNPQIKKITLVGSRNTGTARLDSDADFKVEIDKLPERVHVNSLTGERTVLSTNRDIATVDFTNFMSNTTVDDVAIDPFIVTSKDQGFNVSPWDTKKRKNR